MIEKPENNKFNFLINWLESPYVLNTNSYYKLLISIGIGLFNYLLVYIYEPHHVLLKEEYLHLHAIVSSTIVSAFLLFHYFVLMKLFPAYFNPKKWNIGKHLFVSFYCMLSISIAYWIYLNFYDESFNPETIKFKQILYLVFSFGLFPLIIYFFIDERYGYGSKISTTEKKQKSVTEINNKTSNYTTIYSYNKKDKIKIDTDKLLYITSEANYASFFILENNQIKEHVLRKSLTKIEEDFVKQDNIIRIHKSYFINSNYVNNIKGNARGFFLNLDFSNKEIPVSRKFSRVKLEEIFL